MEFDLNEMSQLAESDGTGVDLYANIHKALRAMMTDSLLAIGRMDPLDEVDLARGTGMLLETLDFCTLHMEHETEFVNTALEARVPGAGAQIAHEHEAQLQRAALLGLAVAMLRGAPLEQREARATELYGDLALFVANNFLHMHMKATAHAAILRDHFTEEELIHIHDRLLVSIPLGELVGGLRWMLPFASPSERTRIVAKLEQKVSESTLKIVLTSVRPHLSEREWGKLTRSLDPFPNTGFAEAEWDDSSHWKALRAARHRVAAQPSGPLTAVDFVVP